MKTTIQKRVVRGGKTVRDVGSPVGAYRTSWQRTYYDVFVDGRQVSPVGGIDSKRAAEAFAAQVSK